MTFLKRYGYSSVGFNLLLSALALQWSIIVQGLIHMYEHEADHFHVDIKVTTPLFSLSRQSRDSINDP